MVLVKDIIPKHILVARANRRQSASVRRRIRKATEKTISILLVCMLFFSPFVVLAEGIEDSENLIVAEQQTSSGEEDNTETPNEEYVPAQEKSESEQDRFEEELTQKPLIDTHGNADYGDEEEVVYVDHPEGDIHAQENKTEDETNSPDKTEQEETDEEEHLSDQEGEAVNNDKPVSGSIDDNSTVSLGVISDLRRKIEKEVLERLQKEFGPKTDENKRQENAQHSFFGFAENECAVLSENEIHCFKKKISSPREAAGLYTGVFSKQGSGGRGEIYLQKGDRVVKVSDNDYDNSSPSWDGRGALIAWQAEIDDRFHIFVRDLEKNRTYQLTAGSKNNINPHVFANGIVWQGWGDHNWEIYYATLKEGEWEIKRITENTWHDVNPRLGEGLVLWETFKNGRWHIFAYHLLNGETTQISKGGEKNKNPRIAVLWDHEDGEHKEIFEYDFSSRKVSLLSREGTDSPPPAIPVPASKEHEAVLTGGQNSGRNGEGLEEETNDDGGE